MKNVLYIISEHFGPSSMISANRFTKITKYLSRLGIYEIYVFARKELRTEDDVLRHEVKELENAGVKIYRIDSGKAYYVNHGVYPILNQMFMRIVDEVYGKDIRTLFEQKATSRKFTANAVDIILRDNLPKPDVIISTYGEMGGHTLALKIKRDIARSAKWIADYRDPIFYGVNVKKARDYYDIFSAEVENKADLLVMISDNLSKAMKLSSLDKIRVITNGYDQEEYDNALSYDKLRFSYSGSYYISDIKILFEVISNLIGKELIDINRIEFNYSGEYSRAFRKHMEEYGLDVCMNDWGACSRKQSLQIQNMSDVVIITSRTYDDYTQIPGKMSGVFGSDKPIICISQGSQFNTEIKRRVEEMEEGYCFEEPTFDVDIGKIEKLILHYYNQKISRDDITLSKNDKKLKYEYSVLAGEYNKLVTSLLADNYE